MDGRDVICRDRLVLDMWHPIAALIDVDADRDGETTLLGEPVRFRRNEDGAAVAWRAECSREDRALPAVERYCHLWTSLGEPRGDLFAIPQHGEGDRLTVAAGTFGVNTSAPRAVENFLDLGHLPFVHAGLLGAEPYTEVTDYEVEMTSDPVEIVVTRCFVFQPVAGPSATGGQISEYTFRVPHPYCSVLYKTSPVDPSRMDVIALFVQAMAQDWCRAHFYACRIDTAGRSTAVRQFSHRVFGNDMPILENQFPRRLPLDTRAETPIPADKSAIAYRRWLSNIGLTYGVIPAA